MGSLAVQAGMYKLWGRVVNRGAEAGECSKWRDWNMQKALRLESKLERLKEAWPAWHFCLGGGVR